MSGAVALSNIRDEIAQAQRLAGHAQSRADMTSDRRQKKLWQEIANEWLARVDMLMNSLPPGEPGLPTADGNPASNGTATDEYRPTRTTKPRRG